MREDGGGKKPPGSPDGGDGDGRGLGQRQQPCVWVLDGRVWGGWWVQQKHGWTDTPWVLGMHPMRAVIGPTRLFMGVWVDSGR